MIVLIEEYGYAVEDLKKAKKGLEEIGLESNGVISLDQVGYYMSSELKDCVFILPKVVLWLEETKDPQGKTCDEQCACKKDHEGQSASDLFYDSIDNAYDMVEEAVAHFFSKLVEAYSPDKSVSGEVSVSGPLEPIVQETLDLAVAAGLLKRSVRYSLGDYVLDKLAASKSTKKPSAKKSK